MPTMSWNRTPKTDIKTDIETAACYYERETGRPPTLCRLAPRSARRMTVAIDGIRIISDPSLRSTIIILE